MAKSFHLYLRLVWFLLLSIGMHAGLLLWDWTAAAGEPGPVSDPVLVALLPVPMPASPGSGSSASPQPDQPQAPAPIQPIKTSPPPALTEAEKVVPASRQVQAAPAKAPVRKAKADRRPIHRSSAAAVVPVAVPAEFTPTAPVRVAAQEMEPKQISALAGSIAAEPSAGPVAPAEGEAESREIAQAGEGTEPSQDIVAATGAELIEAIPDYSSNPLPEYPYLARQKHWQGVVWLLVDVSTTGFVKDLRIEQSCGHSVLDRAASRSVRHWRFTPARRGGQPMASQVRIPVRFRLEDS